VVDQAELSTSKYLQDLLEDKAVSYIEDTTSPFFMYFASPLVHTEVHTPPDVPDLSAQCNGASNVNYCKMVYRSDMTLDVLVETLKTEGKWDKTLLIVASDNGGSKKSGASNAPFRGSKGQYTEGGVRSIGLVTGGALPQHMRGTTYNGIVHIVDIFATLVAYGSRGKTIPSDIDGINMWKAWYDDDTTARSTVLIGLKSSEAAIRMGNYKYMDGVTQASNTFTGLYDVVNDEHEDTDISGDHPDIVASLTALLDEYCDVMVDK
jgi:arylsulfatase A-like enzyme